MEKFQIGWYTVPEDKEFRITYECAAWYTDILVKAGKYPMMAGKFSYHERDKKYTNQVDYNSISIILPGTVVADDLRGRYFGSLIGDGSGLNKHIGEESQTHLSPYAYSVATSILNGTSKYELLPEYQAQEIHYEWDGEQKTTHGIFKVA